MNKKLNKNNIIVFLKNSGGISPVIKTLIDDTSRLLRIKGYYTEFIDNSLHYYNFNSKDKFLSLPKNDDEKNEEYFIKIETKLLNEISLFPVPDLFILDQVGKFECRSDRFCRQMLTIFQSRIPVIIVLDDQLHPAYNKIKEAIQFQELDMNHEDYRTSYQKLLELLT